MALLVAGLLVGSWTAAIAEISLGVAQNVTVLAGSTITSTGATTIAGNIALSPGPSVTGFPPGTIIDGSLHINDALANQAHADALTAYTTLANETLTTNLTGMDLGGLTLTPGIYHFDTSAQLSGILALDTGGDPNAVFHFQIGTTFTIAIGSAITVLNGDSLDVFWQIGTSATIGSNSFSYGNMIANQSISFGTGADLYGRALAINGAVTLDTNQITGPQTLSVPESKIWASTAIAFTCFLLLLRRRTDRKKNPRS